MADNDLEFEGENPEEKIVFVLHRHPWSLLKNGLTIVMLLLVLTGSVLAFGASRTTSIVIFIIVPLILYFLARTWFTWSNSVYVLTNERLISVHQAGWFVRSVTEVTLTNITTIGHDVRGAAATLFNFGDIIIQSSGAKEKDMTLTMVYNPYEVQQRIVRAQRGETNTSSKS